MYHLYMDMQSSKKGVGGGGGIIATLQTICCFSICQHVGKQAGGSRGLWTKAGWSSPAMLL